MILGNIQTTDEQFKAFVRSAEYHIQRLGLSDWSVHFGLEETAESYACCHVYADTRTAVLTLTASCTQNNVGAFNPAEHGKHEVIELLLWQLKAGCLQMYNEARVDEWVHEVVRRLEKALPDMPKEA